MEDEESILASIPRFVTLRSILSLESLMIEFAFGKRLSGGDQDPKVVLAKRGQFVFDGEFPQ